MSTSNKFLESALVFASDLLLVLGRRKKYAEFIAQTKIFGVYRKIYFEGISLVSVNGNTKPTALLWILSVENQSSQGRGL